MIKLILTVGAGGFVGTVLRFLIYRMVESPGTATWPWGTIAVNIIGSLLAGLLFGLSQKSNILSPSTQLFLMVGFCGGFTTFSAFALDTLKLFQSGALLQSFLYVCSTLILGVAALFIGYYLTSK